jgi:clan AA aspartic protease
MDKKIESLKKAEGQRREGAVYQDIWVANPGDMNKRMMLRFLVDTGCSGSAIPLNIAKQLGLQPIGEGYAVMADGQRIHTFIAYVYMRIDDEHVFTLVTYNGCDEPLLGVDIMGLLNLQVDVGNKKILKPMRRFTLRNILFGKGWISWEHTHERLHKKSSN